MFFFVNIKIRNFKATRINLKIENISFPFFICSINKLFYLLNYFSHQNNYYNLINYLFFLCLKEKEKLFIIYKKYIYLYNLHLFSEYNITI